VPRKIKPFSVKGHFVGDGFYPIRRNGRTHRYAPTLVSLFGEIAMKKIVFVLIGLLLGFLFAEIVRRPKMKRLHEFEADAAERKAQHAEDEKAWQAELAAMPFAERMDWELFEAALKQSNYQPDWDESDEGDNHAPQT
jgi:hypothetical protein